MWNNLIGTVEVIIQVLNGRTKMILFYNYESVKSKPILQTGVVECASHVLYLDRRGRQQLKVRETRGRTAKSLFVHNGQ